MIDQQNRKEMVGGASAAGREPLILVVDDDDLVRQALRLFLLEDGYRVVEAEDGDQALTLFHHHQPDIVLMDANMPRKDGFAACREIKQSPEGDQVPVLIVTVMEDEDSIDRGFEAGADDYIPKPLNWALLSRRVRNLIARKQAEAEQKQLEMQLRQAQKMEAIGQLTGGIAHDFNNILASVVGHAELAQPRCEQLDEQELCDSLDHIIRSGRRAQELISQMLTFSRNSESRRRALSANKLVKEAEKLLRPILPASIELHSWYEQAGLILRADPSQLHQVIMNLGINARDAMEDKGHMQLSLVCRTAVQSVCTACQEPVTGDFIEISLADTGPGIAEERLTRIFEPFYTSKETGKGTGLGLSMVHGIVHEHGGHILVESAPGHGTRFRLLFPLSTEQPEEPLDQQKTVRPWPKQQFSGRVLVVDDEPSVAAFLEKLLISMGFEVAIENEPERALARFQQDPDAFKVVFTDQTMPGLTGAELAGQMMRLRPQLPIILCTGFSTLISEDKAREMGIGGYLSKPFDIGKLQNMLHAMLDA